MIDEICSSCGQSLPQSILTVEGLRSALERAEFEYWEDILPGVEVSSRLEGLPMGATITVVANETEVLEDSYGYISESEGYVVLEVSFAGQTNTFKLPGTNSSYNGWEWEYSQLKPVTPKTVTVTTWE